MDPTAIALAEAPFEDRRRRVCDVDDPQWTVDRAVRVLEQVSPVALIEDHHLVDRRISAAVRRIDDSQELRRRWIGQIDDVYSTRVPCSEVTTISDHNRLEKLQIRARIVMAVKRRGIRVRNVHDKNAPAVVASHHRDIPVSVYIREFKSGRSRAGRIQIRAKTYRLGSGIDGENKQSQHGRG